MIWGVSWGRGIVFAGLLALAPIASATELQSLKLSEEGGSTRIEGALSVETSVKAFLLENPRRAVLDFKGTRHARLLKWPAARGSVLALRSAAQPNGTLRVVFELAPDSTVNWLALARQDRIKDFVFEVQGAGASAAPAPGPGSAPPPSVVEPGPAIGVVQGAPEAGRLQPVKTVQASPWRGRDVVVAIDAGHGGQDPGAIGRAGTREKDVVLDISRRLAERINREPGMRAVLTRDGDYFLTLRQRIRRARDAGAQLFVSVHADAVRDPTVSGSSVYVLSEKGATDEQARWLADRENAADLAGGVSLDDKDPVIASVLVDLAQSAQIGQSMVAAERVLRSLASVNEVRKPMVQQAGFVVLKSPDIPSMLVETAFISSPSDERLLNRRDKREALAAAIFGGVRQYFIDHPPDGSRFAETHTRGDTVVATVPEARERRTGQL